MEDKKLNEKESIELIAAMIERTKTRLCLGDGNIMLMWGYLTVGVSALVWVLLLATRHPAVNWLWFLIWIIGGTIMPSMLRKKRTEKGAGSYTDALSAGIWKVVGWGAIVTTFMCLAFMLMGGIVSWSAMFVFALVLVGFAETAQGIIVKERSLVCGGAIGLLAGCFTVCCIAGGLQLYVNMYMPVFITAFICMMIIPGHILNHKAKSVR